MFPGMFPGIFADPAVEISVPGEARAPRGSAGELVRDERVLRAAPSRSAAELLTRCPGVQLTQHGGEGKAQQLYYRGFDAQHGQDIEIWAGGAPVNQVSNVHGQGYADLHFLMPEVVEELHCLPGSYSARQGDFAVAGSLQLKLGYREPGLSAKLAWGSFGARRYFLGYSPEGGDGRTFAAAELYRTEGFGPSRAARRASLIAQAALTLPGGIGARLLATSHAGRFASAGVLRQRDIEQGAVDRFATYDPRQGGDSSRSQLVLELHDPRREGWAVSPYVVHHDMRLRQNFTGWLLDPVAGDSVQQQNDATTLGLTSRYRTHRHAWGQRVSLEAGFFARTDWIRQSQRRLSSVDDAVTREDVDARVRTSGLGGYVEGEWRAHPSWSARAGARLDGLAYSAEDGGTARSSQGTHAGAKATVEYRPWSWLSAMAAYGDGFRSPQARSLAEGERTPFTTVRSYEAGARLRDGRGTSASVALFQTLLSEDLAFDPATARNERTPGTRRTGVSAELSSALREWFVSALSITYTRSEFRSAGQGYAEGELLPFVPACVVRADSAFTPRLGLLAGYEARVRIGSGLTYLGQRPLPFGERGRDVLLVDTSAGLSVGRVELELEVYNLLDADWYDGQFVYPSSFGGEGASLIPLRHVTVGAPRSVMLTLAVAI